MCLENVQLALETLFGLSSFQPSRFTFFIDVYFKAHCRFISAN